jgi:hypothetical protein
MNSKTRLTGKPAPCAWCRDRCVYNAVKFILLYLKVFHVESSLQSSSSSPPLQFRAESDLRSLASSNHIHFRMYVGSFPITLWITGREMLDVGVEVGHVWIERGEDGICNLFI